MKFYLIIIFISFLSPFVSARVSDEAVQEIFSSYVDTLIGCIVPFFVFAMIDYEYDNNGSRTLACLARSIVYLINIGVQQEIAFAISSVKISNFIKILQHVVTGFIGLEVVLNFIIYIFLSTKPNEKEENYKKVFNNQLQKLKSKIQTLKKNVEKDIRMVKENIKKHEIDFKTFKSNYETFEKDVKKRLKTLEDSVGQNKSKVLKTNLVPINNVITGTMKVTPTGNTISNNVNLVPTGDIKKQDIVNNFIRMLFFLDYSALILLIILLSFLLNDLKENFTTSFFIALIISISLTFIFQSLILFFSFGEKLKKYIKNFNDSYDGITFKNHVYIDIIADFININVLYLPVLINCFLLETPAIFNKIFLSLSSLLVTTWIVLMYKKLLKEEEEEVVIKDVDDDDDDSVYEKAEKIDYAQA
jgi:Skp family chaperone for outer membrane proteins